MFVGFVGNWIIVVACGLIVVVAPCMRLRVRRKNREADVEVDDNTLVGDPQTHTVEMNEELVKRKNVDSEIVKSNGGDERSLNKSNSFFGTNSWNCGRAET